MSRGRARESLARRIGTFVAGRELPGKDGELHVPAVYEQRGPVENDPEELPGAPAVIVHLGKSVQDQGRKTAPVTIVVITYAEDSEQGYRDAENLAEAIETDLVADPWVDHDVRGLGAAYKLTGPFEVDVIESLRGPAFGASVGCVVVLPAVESVVGPAGEDFAQF